MKKEYTFLYDPGHGWAMIPLEDIEALYPLENKISSYSFFYKGHALLEEDCDASEFWEAAKAAGWDIKFNEVEVNFKVRDLPRWDHKTYRMRRIEQVYGASR